MNRPQSLADYLGPDAGLPPNQESSSDPWAPMFLTGEQFAEKVLASREFMQYVLNGLTLGSIPAAVLIRIMDYGPNWGKPTDRIEHTGKDGRPIETITEVRRVVIHVQEPQSEDDEQPSVH